MQKTKRKHGAFQNLLHHISTMEALQNIIQTDSGSYSEGLQLSFFDHFGTWSCDHSPNKPCDISYHSYLVFINERAKEPDEKS